MGAQDTPAAEVAIDTELVHRLLAGQHPDLAGRPLTVLASGWDNVMVAVGADLLARLPRRAVAAELVRNEQRWLPVLAPRLPLPVPAPVRLGRPGEGYPWSWSVLPWLPGTVAARTPPTDPGAAADMLGRFLGALHAPAPPDRPRNPVRGGPLADRDAMTTARVEALAGFVDAAAVSRHWRDALDVPPWPGPPVWLHGDLHPANLLVADGRLSAVIDFGDLTGGDPATDLAVAWMLLPEREHGTLRAGYRAVNAAGVDDATWARARGWALSLALAFLAHSADDPVMAGIARRALGALLT
jgi:aminoglycoside phosphotransferase (APT) family kinase protein